jgi:hypothetical protein
MELLSAINGSSFYAEYAASAEKDKLGRDITTAYLTAVPTGTMNTSSFAYDGQTITSYNGSAFPAGGGDMYESNLGQDNNVITSYNNYPFKDTTITTDLSNLQTVSSTVATNSSTNWENVITGVSVDNTALVPTNKVVNIDLSNKVDVVDGKGLSTNDYDNAATAVVANASAVIPNDADATNQLVSNSTMQAAIANVGHFEIAPLVNDEPSVQNPSTKIFYLTKPSTAAATDPYTEWIYTSSSPSNTAWNAIGSTEIDLDGYAQIPASYTANHIAIFGSNTDVLQDAGVTINDLQGSITGITINGGSEITPISKVVNIPVATNTQGVGTDGAMAGADKVKLDGIAAGANVNVQADWSESDSTSDAYIANKPDIVIPLSSNAFAKPTNIVVVSAMPASPDPTTIYLVKEAT